MQVQGTLQLPGDKSISHRAIMLSAIADGVSYVRNLNDGADLQSTINILRDCGASIKQNENEIIIYGKELYSPSKELDCGNSGTTTRLIAGLLSSQKLSFTLIGDKSLSRRPMKRIITPLVQMGCKISSNDGLLPLSIDASDGVSAIHYNMKVASAQVKSSILFSALGGNNVSSVNEIIPTRNHSEIMLKNMGASIESEGSKIIVYPLKSKLKSIDISVPSDPSSAAFFVALAVINNNSNLKLTNVLLNDSRIGFIEVLNKMNCLITKSNESVHNGEKVGDLTISASNLKAIEIESKTIPSIIDEVPILAVVAAFAKGITVFKSVEELKYKECDRLSAIIHNLEAFGINAYEKNNDLFVEGGKVERMSKITTFDDHRIAMAFTILSLTSFEKYELDNMQCVDISLPNFFNYLSEVTK
ncbi:MAG: 3-phosphoshikimate 1-carboxyvinyltransferase [Candidatus Marinimicrobia bacterium]|nr:3-phosphoshikimate 1-carboxyvinyltransferase [Candidatus Neomarinimicrobiota bacterium]MDA1363850.1 3-phosphoshikimate 1-carboxyvinyltransferase [Candidatus Neomarinimicrobiota bacterium]